MLSVAAGLQLHTMQLYCGHPPSAAWQEADPHTAGLHTAGLHTAGLHTLTYRTADLHTADLLTAAAACCCHRCLLLLNAALMARSWPLLRQQTM
jgi:hypothetical protein